jgi:serine/threonine protein kinase
MGDNARQLQPGDVFAGCRIRSLVGRGGTGLVYRARQKHPDRTVAVKILAPAFADQPHFRMRFERERRAVVALEHHNVIPIYAADEEDGRLYLVMRFVESTDLGARLVRCGRFAAHDAARLTAQIASALDAAHECRLVHRDVKPSNVLVTGDAPNEHLYLTDFGLAQAADDTLPGLTATGSFVGTLDYVAPEQVGGGPVDARADVYALGCVLYQMLTGSVPFPVDLNAEKIRCHLSAPPPAPSDAVPYLGAAFDAVVARAMAKDPAARFQSAGELARAATAAAGRVTDSVIARAEEVTVDEGGSGASAVPVDAGEDVGEEETPRAPTPGPQTAERNIYNGKIHVSGGNFTGSQG